MIEMNTNDYFIYLTDILIGVARNVGTDMPNIGGVFEATPEFEPYRDLFEREYLLIKGPSEKWLAVKDEIFRLGLKLERRSTGEVILSTPGKMPGPEFRNEIAYLHIHDSKVWWRLM